MSCGKSFSAASEKLVLTEPKQRSSHRLEEGRVPIDDEGCDLDSHGVLYDILCDMLRVSCCAAWGVVCVVWCCCAACCVARGVALRRCCLACYVRHQCAYTCTWQMDVHVNLVSTAVLILPWLLLVVGLSGRGRNCDTVVTDASLSSFWLPLENPQTRHSTPPPPPARGLVAPWPRVNR